MKRFGPLLSLLCALGVHLFTGAASAMDYWVHSGDPAVVVNNDCGQVSRVVGKPRIHRSFTAVEEGGLDAFVADRLQSGDEVEVPDGSRLEWISGSNMIVVVGPMSRVKLNGIRNFTVEGLPVSRLDVELLGGELRMQVRLNSEHPEAILARVNGADLLVVRGDVQAHSSTGWRSVVLEGEGLARQRRGAVVGAPFTYAGAIGSLGEERPDEEELLAIKARLPFTFEVVRAALPPLPAMSRMLEAP